MTPRRNISINDGTNNIFQRREIIMRSASSFSSSSFYLRRSLPVVMAALVMMSSGLYTLIDAGASAGDVSSSKIASFDQPFSSSFIKLQHAPCVTLYYRQGRVGCGTAANGVSQQGTLIYFDDGSVPNTNQVPFVAVLENHDITAASFNTLMKHLGGLLQGILVLNSTYSSAEKQYYSPDSMYPQGYGTPSEPLQYGDDQYPWNPNGQDLFALDLFGIPMAYVLDKSVSDSLRHEAQVNVKNLAANEDRIVASFNYYMGGDAIDSEQCLQWKDMDGTWSPKCLPLGGNSVWATPGSPPDPNKNQNANGNGPRPVIVVGAGIDSNSFFHDVTPGANTAASNIVTMLMVSKLLGAYMNDNIFDNLSMRIVVAFFQGENFGFLGSRSFFNDLLSFQCSGTLVHSISRLTEQSDDACLDPMRPSMAFSNLGSVQGVLSMDQVAQQVQDGYLYVHADLNNDENEFGAFLANVLIYSKTSSVSVAAANVNNNDNGQYPYPSSPLTSALQISQGAMGGALLTGYDNVYSNNIPYHSVFDNSNVQTISLPSIAAAATIMARAALAAAYGGGNDNYDAEGAAQYATNLIPELSDNDETLITLADCFLYHGNCPTIQKYASMEADNDRTRTGISGISVGTPLGTPPNYYVGVYSSAYGQPFVQVGDNWYGAHNGDNYGSKASDAVGIIPRQLEASIHGLLNDFLGRGSAGNANEGDSSYLVKCSKLNDCVNVNYCPSYGEYAVCTGGGYCVCSRAHYHVALDEALTAAVGEASGFFQVRTDNDDAKIMSPMYAEPYWSADVGITVYRDVGWRPGFFTLISGVVAILCSFVAASALKVGLQKEKLY